MVGGGGGGARDGRTAGTLWSFKCVVRFGGLSLRHRFFFVLRGCEITAGRVALPMRDASRSCTPLAWGRFHLFWTVPRAVRGFLDCFMRDLACFPASHLCHSPAALCCRSLGPRPRRPLLTVFVDTISYGTMLAAPGSSNVWQALLTLSPDCTAWPIWIPRPFWCLSSTCHFALPVL